MLLREWKRVGPIDCREAAGRKIGEQRCTMNRLLVIGFRVPQVTVIGIRRDDLAGNQAVFAEAANRLVVPTLEIQVAIFDEAAIDMRRGKRGKTVDDRFITVLATRRCREGWL